MGVLDFLNQFKTEKGKIGIYISPKSILEVVEFDYEDKKVLKYGYEELEYNISTREIDNFADFESKLQHLFEDLKISPNSEIILSLPTILMGYHSFPRSLDDDSLAMALTSEVENNYIFKKNEPIISWQEVLENVQDDARLLCYSALQRQEIKRFEEVFERLGYNLISIDTSFAALVRGVYLTGLVDESIESNSNWNILLITPNSSVILGLKGNKLLEVFESPLAIKSFSHEQIYPTIAMESLLTLEKLPARQLVVVSESNDVSAEILVNALNLNIDVNYIECNKFTNEEFIPCELTVLPNKKRMLSPEVIGTACWNRTPLPLNFKFSLNNSFADTTFAKEVEFLGFRLKLTSQLVQYVLIGIIIILSLIFTVNYFIISTIINAQTNVLQQLAAEKNNLNRSIQSLSSTPSNVKIVDSKDVITDNYNANKDFLISYASVAANFPEQLQIDKLEIKDNLNVTISGKANKVKDIVSYFQSLKKLSKFKNLNITLLKVVNPSDSTTSTTMIKQPSSQTSGSLPMLPSIVSIAPKQSYYEFEFGALTSTDTNAQSTTSTNNHSSGEQPRINQNRP